MITADVGELCRFFKTDSIEEVRQKFQNMEINETPDGLSVPSLTVGYVRTGDYLYVPMGALMVSKAINANVLCLRPLSQSLRTRCSSH